MAGKLVHSDPMAASTTRRAIQLYRRGGGNTTPRRGTIPQFHVAPQFTQFNLLASKTGNEVYQPLQKPKNSRVLSRMLFVRKERPLGSGCARSPAGVLNRCSRLARTHAISPAASGRDWMTGSNVALSTCSVRPTSRRGSSGPSRRDAGGQEPISGKARRKRRSPSRWIMIRPEPTTNISWTISALVCRAKALRHAGLNLPRMHKP